MTAQARPLWRACPKCGDIGFDYINGRDELTAWSARLAVVSSGQPTIPAGWRSGFRLASRQPEDTRFVRKVSPRYGIALYRST